jgi:hypothetical protein
MKKEFFSISRIFAVTGALVLAVALLSACKKTDVVSTHIPAAGLMAFNLAPDQDGIGIALSGNVLNNTPLYYTGFNGLYQNIYTGIRDIEVFGFTDSVFAKSTFTFDDGQYYSLFVTGNNGVYKNVVVKDEIDSTASAEKAYIRYVNAIADSNALKVTITAGGDNSVDELAAFSKVSPFVAVNGGDVKIALTNGSNVSAERTVTLENGKVYTALLVGVPGATDEDKKIQIRYVQNGNLPTDDAK